MLNKFKLRFSITILFVIFLPVIASAEDVERSNFEGVKKTLVIGKVSDNPKKHYRYLKPMVDYVVERMKDLGVKEGKVLMARDNRQMISYLRQGKVDWVTETPFSSVIFQDKAKAEIILRKWKKGVPDYHTIIFTRKDSGINTLNDLVGKKIAFEDPGSSTAYFIPAAEMISKGLILTQLSTAREEAPEDMVGYVFSGEEVNTSVWVYKNFVSAGAFNNLDWNKYNHMPLEYKTDLKIIYKTKSYPRALELVSDKFPEEYKKRLKSILLKAHEDPEAKSVLRAYQKTKKFDELDKNSRAGLDDVRRLIKIVRDELE